MIIPNIAEAITKVKEAKIKRYPCHISRASTLGYCVPELEGCVRRGVYEVSRWSEKTLHNVDSQYIFDEGISQERQIIKDIIDAGYDPIEQQAAFEYKNKAGKVVCTGHVDFKLNVGESGGGFSTELIPVEIKTSHPAIFDGIHTIEDFKKKSWTHAYLAQITMYMLMQGVDKGLFIFKNKSNGKIKQIEINLDYELGEACFRTAEEIDKHVTNNTLPDQINDRDKCKDCPFNHVCLPDIEWGVELKIAEDPSFEEKLDRHEEIKEFKVEADKLWKETITPKAKASADNGELNIVVGKYHLTAKKGKTFRLKVENVNAS